MEVYRNTHTVRENIHTVAFYDKNIHTLAFYEKNIHIVAFYDKNIHTVAFCLRQARRTLKMSV